MSGYIVNNPDITLHDQNDAEYVTDSEGNRKLVSPSHIFEGRVDNTADLIVTNGGTQIHAAGGGGDDVMNLFFEGIDSQFSADPHGLRPAAGHHLRGDGYSGWKDGYDVFNFVDVDTVSGEGVVAGRIEDFEQSRDKIVFTDTETGAVVELDLNNLDAFDHPDVSDVKVVLYNGQHNDDTADPQQWLYIETSSGGIIFYALEGARVDTENTGHHNVHAGQEQHFLNDMPDFDDLLENHVVDYVDNHVYIPEGYSADADGVEYSDIDTDNGDVLNVIGRDENDNLDADEATIYGDLIAAGLNNDTVYAAAGDDYVWGGSGHDEIHGEAGNDRIWGDSGDDKIYGGNGADTIEGGRGNDRIEGGFGEDQIEGGDGDDRIWGEQDDDYISGGKGHDYIHGGSGNDRIEAGKGDDEIVGGIGHDYLRGGYGNDTISGSNGKDRILGGAGDDILTGGVGKDKFEFYFDNDEGEDTITDFEIGDDKIKIFGDGYDYSDLNFAAYTDANGKSSTKVWWENEDGYTNTINLNDVELADVNADMFAFYDL